MGTHSSATEIVLSPISEGVGHVVRFRNRSAAAEHPVHWWLKDDADNKPYS